MLRKLILLERLPPGMPVRERELAQELGISRTPLNQALRTLEMEGLVEYGLTRRPKVADPTLDEIAKNTAVLGALEALAGEIACRLASDEDIRAINGLNQRMQDMPRSTPPLEFFDLDMEFHTKIVQGARNEPLAETHRQFNARLWRARFMSSRQIERRDNTLAEHQSICEAMSERDAGASSLALRRHLESTIRNIERIQSTGNFDDNDGTAENSDHSG